MEAAVAAPTWSASFRIVAATYALLQFTDSAKTNPVIMNVNRILLVIAIILACIYARVYDYFKRGLEVYQKWRCLTWAEVFWAIALAIAICGGFAFIIIGWASAPLVAAAPPVAAAPWIAKTSCVGYLPGLLFFLYAIFEYINYNYPINHLDFWQSTYRLLTNPIRVICWKANANRTAEQNEMNSYIDIEAVATRFQKE